LFLTGIGFAQTPSQSGSTSDNKPNSQDTQDKDKKSSEPATTKLRIRVMGSNGKPIDNASVYVRFYQPGGMFHHEKLVEMSFKTNEDGSVRVPEVPQGNILIQVIAKGWHTYGKWYDIEKDEESVEIKLEPPTHWY
jgi:nitrogen fixation protein FixH